MGYSRYNHVWLHNTFVCPQGKGGKHQHTCDLLHMCHAAHRLTLQREAGPWRRNQSLAAMIGCYVLRAQDAEGTLPAKDWPKALLHEMTFVPSEVLEEELVLPGGVPLLVVPATYEAGVHGGFVLQACCNMPLEFRPLVVAE